MDSNNMPKHADDDGADEGQEGFLEESDILEVIELQPEENDDLDDAADDVAGMELVAAADDVGASGDTSQQDDAEVIFTKHTGSVFCVALGPVTSSLVVSGGEDDKAFVWNMNTADVMLECTGHKDSVTCVGFSRSGSLVATGDMSGLIKVWNIDKREEVWSFEVDDLEWLQWHHGAPLLLAGTSDGSVWLWSVPQGGCKTMQGPGTACSAGKFTPDGRRACVGYGDGTVKVWDLKTCVATHTVAPGNHGHTAAVTCVDCHHDNTIAVTGSTDVSALIINTVTGKVLCKLQCQSATEAGSDEDSVETVGFSAVQNFVATGSLSGMLTVWDVPTQVARHQCTHEAGIVRLQWHPSLPLVYTCCLDGTVRLWDARSGRQEAQWLGHTAEILDLQLSSDGSTIVTSAGDGTARVFRHQVDR